MNEHRYQHLQTILERLKLTRLSERLDQLAEEAAKESWTYVEFLDRVLDVEVSARVERDVTMKTRLARFPFIKTLEAQRYRQRTPAMAAGRTNRRWTVREVLCCPLSPVPCFTM